MKATLAVDSQASAPFGRSNPHAAAMLFPLNSNGAGLRFSKGKNLYRFKRVDAKSGFRQSRGGR